MKRLRIALLFILFLFALIATATAKETQCYERAGKWYCKIDGSANCKKGRLASLTGHPFQSFEPTLTGSTTEKEKWGYSAPAGFKYVNGSQRAVVSKRRKKAGIET